MGGKLRGGSYIFGSSANKLVRVIIVVREVDVGNLAAMAERLWAFWPKLCLLLAHVTEIGPFLRLLVLDVRHLVWCR